MTPDWRCSWWSRWQGPGRLPDHPGQEQDVKEAAEAGSPSPPASRGWPPNATHLGRWIDKYQGTAPGHAGQHGSWRSAGPGWWSSTWTPWPSWTCSARLGPRSGRSRPLAWVAPHRVLPGVQDPDTGEWVHSGGHFTSGSPEGLELLPAPRPPLTTGAGISMGGQDQGRYVPHPAEPAQGGDLLGERDRSRHPGLAPGHPSVTPRLGASRRAERAERAAEAAASGDVDDHHCMGPSHPMGRHPGGRRDGLLPDARTVARVTSGPGGETTCPPSRPLLTTPGVPIPDEP